MKLFEFLGLGAVVVFLLWATAQDNFIGEFGQIAAIIGFWIITVRLILDKEEWEQ